jgi:fructose-bisphosphate aldolase class II
MYYLANQDYLETQVGNPEGEDKPNKKFYDPRVLFRIAELSMIARAQEIMNNLGKFAF